jgi:hypothetical protein
MSTDADVPDRDEECIFILQIAAQSVLVACFYSRPPLLSQNSALPGFLGTLGLPHWNKKTSLNG